jgi:hypothetical protein
MSVPPGGLPPLPLPAPVYTPHPHHRSAAYSGVKSQWAIPVPEETGCFYRAYQAPWSSKGAYWGLYLVDDRPVVLGSTPISAEAYMAKFVGPHWHGYPVVHWESPFDRPESSVLDQWQRAGYLRKAAKSKIIRGKRCAL